MMLGDHSSIDITEQESHGTMILISLDTPRRSSNYCCCVLMYQRGLGVGVWA